MNKAVPHPASFKDPAGFIFESDGNLYRQVNISYKKEYDAFMSSGLYKLFTVQGSLVPHTEITENLTQTSEWYTTLKLERLPFISYPYEWSFDQLKDAALLTLSIAKKSIEKGMILKDATPFNIQFKDGKPIFIDTLSWELYDDKQPWVAYRQFCECFLYPLYLEHYLKADFIPLLSHYINGIPGDITAKLLPWKSRWNLGVRLHVLLQQNVKKQASTSAPRKIEFSKTKMLNLLQHLESIIQSLQSGYTTTSTWSDYYDHTILGKEYLEAKEKLIQKIVSPLNFNTVLDLGANDGYFSKLLAAKGKQVIAADFDSQCINNLYNVIKKEKAKNIYPVVLDLSNPSASIGFNNSERSSFFERANPDLVLALALVHHLAISKNIPLTKQAFFFASIAPQLIIEFVPNTDDKAKEMLKGRESTFLDYNETIFEKSFSEYYSIENKEQVPGTMRVLYYMKRK